MSLYFCLLCCCLPGWSFAEASEALTHIPEPASGTAPVLGPWYLLSDSFTDCALSTRKRQPLQPSQIRAGQSYCLEAELASAKVIPQPLALWLLVQGASSLYLNGQLIGQNGVPGQDPASEQPGQIEYLFVLPSVLQPGTQLLRLQLSTQHAPPGFFQYFYAAELVEPQQFWQKRQLQHLWLFLLTGALLLAGALVAILSLTLGWRRHWLVFSLLALVSALLLLAEFWRATVGYLYPYHQWRLQLIWLLALAFSLLLPAYFALQYRLPWRWRHWIFVMSLALGVGFLPQGYDGKVVAMMALALLLSLLINLWACRHRVAGSWVGLGIVQIALVFFGFRYLYFAEQGFVWVVLVLLLLLFYQLLSQWSQDQRKAQLALQLENQLLHKSLQPHFLMNSLTLLSELQQQNPVQAEQFIQALSEEFRLLNQFANQRLITLSQELHLCRNYMQLMSIRLQQPHQLHTEADSDELLLPPATLLVLLENAFSHNRYNSSQTFSLQVRSEGKHALLAFRLPLGDKRQHQGTGTGTAWLQQRLQMCFAGKARFSSIIESQHWLIRIELPK